MFVKLYRFFRTHKAVFIISLVGSAILFSFFALKLQFEENIIKLLPQTDKSQDCAVAFGNIKVKDKVFLEIKSADSPSSSPLPPDSLASAMDSFMALLQERDTGGLVANSLYRIDTDDLMNLLYYGMGALPCHLGEDFYPLAERLSSPEAIDSLASGQYPVEFPALGASYTLYDNHLFSPDSTLALCFMSPQAESLDSGAGGKLERLLSSSVKEFRSTRPDVEVLYHGAICESAFNAGQIKKDLVLTVGVSLLLICLIICICFGKARTLLHLIAPIAYGTVFSLACVYLIQGRMSFIAVGIGAIVLGVAMSYCLHVITHQKFVPDVETVIREQTKPVCLGCLTTIGSFAGLLLTSSELLRDFGLFASFAMVGTTFFALAFLPQFFKDGDQTRNEKAFRIVNRINSYPLDRNKAVVAALIVLCAVCFPASRKVRFDSDLAHIGYSEPKIERSKNIYNEKINEGFFSQYFAAHAETLDSAIILSHAMNSRLDSLQKAGVIHSWSGTEGLLLSEQEQRENILRWKQYWTPARTQRTFDLLSSADSKYGWSQTTGFDIPSTFRLMAEADYEPQSLHDAGVVPEGLLCNFVEHNEDGWLVFSSALFDRDSQFEVCEAVIAGQRDVVVLDPFHYTGDMVEIVHSDFNIMLLVSSIFVFIVLLLSFRSLVLALIAFLPMFLSWYILQGIMAIFGIEFNLVNIMISSFIFGIGVDYSIFVMEGLLNKDACGSHRLLICHKAAIFFSAATLIIVTGSLLFAVHPSIHSIGLCTIIGMSATILITYALQPLLFRLLKKTKWKRKQLSA